MTVGRCRSLFLAWAGPMLAAGLAPAQPAAAPRQKELVQSVGPDAIRRVANLLKPLQGGDLSPQLQEALKQLAKQNPEISPEHRKLAQQYLRQHPELRNPEQLEKFLRQFEGMKLPGMPGADANIPPGGLQPSLPQKHGLPPPMPVPQHELPPAGGENRPGLPERPDAPDVPPPGVTPEGNFPMPPQMPGEGDEGRPLPAPEFGAGNDPEQQARRHQQWRAIAGWWEKNVGPLDQSPAVKELLMDMLAGRSGSSADGGSLGDLLDAAASGDGSGFGKWAENMGLSGWKMPDLGLGGGKGELDLDGGWTTPNAPSGASLSGFGSAGGSWLPVILFGLVAAAGLVLWWLWPKLTGEREAGPRPLPGLGPWPVDPRKIADRDALVRAFEYLSVLVCGSGAKTWNHVTIAAALERAVPQAEALAEPLARLYAVARYTPADEPLPAGAITEAREYLCELAGVPAA